MERKSTKRLITEAVFEKLPTSARIGIDQAIFRWWMSGRQDGLRLTELGDKAFKLADVESFSHPLEKITSGKWYTFLLELSKKMKCPYYIGVKDNKNFIRIYDSKIAMLITLYGTFQEYLDSIKSRK